MFPRKRFRSQRWYPASADPRPEAGLGMVRQRALVGAVDAKVRDAVCGLAQHEGARKWACLHPVVELVGRVDLGDPGIALVPLRADPARGCGRLGPRPRRVTGGVFVARWSAAASAPLKWVRTKGRSCTWST